MGDRQIIVKKELLKDIPDLCRIWEVRAYTEYSGCQCSGNCSCMEEFKREDLHYFQCTKLKGKIRTFTKFSLEDCYKELEKRGVSLPPTSEDE